MEDVSDDGQPTLRIEVTDAEGHQVTREFDIEATVGDVLTWAVTTLAQDSDATVPSQYELVCGSIPASLSTLLYEVESDGSGHISDGETFESEGQTYVTFIGLRFCLVEKQIDR